MFSEMKLYERFLATLEMSQKHQCFVLVLSGGQESTVSFVWAILGISKKTIYFVIGVIRIIILFFTILRN